MTDDPQHGLALDQAATWLRSVGKAMIALAVACMFMAGVNIVGLVQIKNILNGLSDARDRQECASKVSAEAWGALFAVLQDPFEDQHLSDATREQVEHAKRDYADINELCPVGGDGQD